MTMSRILNIPRSIRKEAVFVLAVLSCLAFMPFSHAAETWKPSQMIQPKELAGQLATGKEKPLIIQVGFLTLYKQSHIPEALYCGPASKPEGLKQIRECLAKVPLTRQIVIYCGCCPWKDCPNVKPAFLELTRLGYKNFKVLEIPQTFGEDWVKKGFPLASGK